MEITQNVTLAIPKDVLRKAKILTFQKNTSLWSADPNVDRPCYSSGNIRPSAVAQSKAITQWI